MAVLLLLQDLASRFGLYFLLHDLELLQHDLVDDFLGPFANTHLDTYYNM